MADEEEETVHVDSDCEVLIPNSTRISRPLSSKVKKQSSVLPATNVISKIKALLPRDEEDVTKAAIYVDPLAPLLPKISMSLPAKGQTPTSIQPGQFVYSKLSAIVLPTDDKKGNESDIAVSPSTELVKVSNADPLLSTNTTRNKLELNDNSKKRKFSSLLQKLKANANTFYCNA